ncbi:MAG: hypothetical protein PHD54_14530 [Desulfuromonadaceae bacterium]|nr:hypothetical protein [Desulfuromonadaceae bacterium]
MDISSISGTSLMMRAEQTQQTVSTAVIRQVADQQNQIANMLAQIVQQAPQPTSNSGTGYSFSTYA